LILSFLSAEDMQALRAKDAFSNQNPPVLQTHRHCTDP